jgi:hypothetical protein
MKTSHLADKRATHGKIQVQKSPAVLPPATLYAKIPDPGT